MYIVCSNCKQVLRRDDLEVRFDDTIFLDPHICTRRHSMREKTKHMPEVLKQFLENLNDGDADSIWNWVDDDIDSTGSSMADILCLSHQHLQ